MNKTYWIRKSPKGKYFGRPSEYKFNVDSPKTDKIYESYGDYEREIKKLGWTIVKVKLTEVSK